MDMAIGNRRTSGVSLVKLDQHGVYPANAADNGAMKVDALRVQDQKGDYYLASKPGLMNSDKMATGRGSQVVIDGKPYTADANINRADTALEKVDYTARKAADGVGRMALSALGLGMRAVRSVTGG